MVSGDSVTDMFLGKRDLVEDHQTFSGADIERIDLDVQNAKINIQPTTERDITVEYKGEVSPIAGATDQFIADQQGDELSINKEQFPMAFIFNLGTHNEINLYLPEKTFKAVNLDVAAAKIDVVGLQANQLDIETSAGKIDLASIKSNQTTIESSAGAVDIDQITGDLDVDTSAGRVVINLEKLEQNIDVDSSVGEVVINTLKTPDNMRLDFSASAGSGDVEVPLEFDVRSHNRIKGIVGDGDYKVYVRTSAGAFRFNVVE